ncbi:MAG: type IV pilus biogenesis/stability protein PilW [Gammaproteobacteria bacterium HGW-Gammaproteobacteria-3]|nr:MAG: type IV pilus biogenesis/stability protein PilW [Gammaproteobacteria bacterium HGW-Gammaproteobacteria-3]
MRLNGKFTWLLAGVLAVLLALSGCSSKTKTKQEESADTHLQLGVRYIDMDKLAIAREHLEKAHSLDSQNARITNALAYLYEKLKQPERARKLYEEALDTTSEDLGVLNNYGRFLCDRGRYETGLEYLKQAIDSPLNNRQWLALTNAGRCELAQEHTAKAEAYFRQALQLQPFYAAALSDMQAISYRKGEYWAAKGFLGRYLSVARHTSQTLWYAYQTERALGNQAAAEDYKKLLHETYPLSEQAQQLDSVRQKNNGE